MAETIKIKVWDSKKGEWVIKEVEKDENTIYIDVVENGED